MSIVVWYFVFFFNDTATTEIYTLSLHDALPILNPTPKGSHRNVGVRPLRGRKFFIVFIRGRRSLSFALPPADRKSTRLNSSHANISYAVFCLKKKKQKDDISEKQTTSHHSHPSH